MPSFDDIAKESSIDYVRRKYIRKLHEHTDRNVIIYYSGWLQRDRSDELVEWITDDDINGFMATTEGVDRSKGLDLILHTPGGEINATETIVSYVRKMYGTDYRVIIPQLALSAGTMIACSAKSIVMGKQSSIGPTDPQIGGLPAKEIIAEFERIYKEIKDDPLKIEIWAPTLAALQPGIWSMANKAIKHSNELVGKWLRSGMFVKDPESDTKSDEILNKLTDTDKTLNHGRQIDNDQAKEMGLIIEDLEDDQKLQDLVLSIHHACMISLQTTDAFKIIENHLGRGPIKTARWDSE